MIYWCSITLNVWAIPNAAKIIRYAVAVVVIVLSSAFILCSPYRSSELGQGCFPASLLWWWEGWRISPSLPPGGNSPPSLQQGPKTEQSNRDESSKGLWVTEGEKSLQRLCFKSRESCCAEALLRRWSSSGTPPYPTSMIWSAGKHKVRERKSGRGSCSLKKPQWCFAQAVRWYHHLKVMLQKFLNIRTVSQMVWLLTDTTSECTKALLNFSN